METKRSDFSNIARPKSHSRRDTAINLRWLWSGRRHKMMIIACSVAGNVRSHASIATMEHGRSFSNKWVRLAIDQRHLNALQNELHCISFPHKRTLTQWHTLTLTIVWRTIACWLKCPSILWFVNVRRWPFGRSLAIHCVWQARQPLPSHDLVSVSLFHACKFN